MVVFSFGGHSYRSRKIPAMTLFHVMRKLAPLVSALSAADVAQAGGEKFDVWAIIPKLSEALAGMPNEDCEYVLGACLGAVQRQRPGDTGWAEVWSPAAKAPMFEDISLADMLFACFQIIMAEIAPFLPAPASQ